MVKRVLGWVLLAHGVVCLLGAFFPFYPPVFLFYWFFPGHFFIKLVIVLLAGASQVVCGFYLALEKRWQVRWYWLASIIVVLTGLFLIFPVLHSPGLFTGLVDKSEPPYPSSVPGLERPDDIILTPFGPRYKANFHQEGTENPWPSIQTKEEMLGGNVHVVYRAYIETKAGEARNNILRVTTPSRDIKSLNLYTSNVPSGIEVKHGTKWHGPRTIAQVLIIEVSQDVQPNQYSFEIGVQIDGKDYGTVPCTIKVLEWERNNRANCLSLVEKRLTSSFSTDSPR